MTERIDLDELDAGDDDEDAPNPGDWFWREEGDPPDEPEAVTEIKTTNSETADAEATANATSNSDANATSNSDANATADADDNSGGDAADDSAASPSASESVGSGPMPRVPRENEDKPVGVPTESGGAGGVPAGADAADASSASASDEAAGASAPDAPAADAADAPDTANAPETSAADAPETTAADTPDTADEPNTADAADTANAPETTAADEREATGPHGGGADDMTLAFTYEAATRLSNFGGVAADAYGWADWVGIVGRVPAHVINKFQRDRNVDLDFFNGGGTDPGERLARMGPSSMFYAERMVVVGLEGEDEEIAEKADWEFVPLSDAAEKADWDVTE